jgi:RNA ligase (TIGR02306 family)
MERSLASIQKVEKIEPIEGADRIDKATVLGWHLVVLKGEFKEGDLGVYFEIDSMLPDLPAFAFLKDPKGKIPAEGFIHRLKTKKLRGVISQGLLIPMNAFDFTIQGKLKRHSIGDDVTEILGIKKYEPPVNVSLRTGQAKSTFPSFIPKTDETRIQSIPWIVGEFQGKKVYVTTKLDGTSLTCYLKGDQFGVCSRNMEWKKPVPEPVWRQKVMKVFAKLANWGFGTRIHSLLRSLGYLRNWQAGAKNTYWEVAEQLNIELLLGIAARKLESKDWAIQGEICGPGIQKNRLGLKENQLFVFDVYNISERRFLNYEEQKSFVELIGLKRVPDVGVVLFIWSSVDEILKFAEGKYENGHNREGIVIRTVEETEWRRLGRGSFKAINNSYLLETGD